MKPDAFSKPPSCSGPPPPYTARRGKVAWSLLIPLLCLLLGSGPLSSPQQSWKEDQIKAVFVYNLTFFVFWKKDILGPENQPFRILNLGNEIMETVLEKAVTGESIMGHAISVDHIPLHALADYQIIFIPKNMTTRTSSILSANLGSQTLLVGETLPFLAAGGMISFVRTDTRIQIYINKKSLEQAGIQISSKLQQISHIVSTPRESQP